MIGARIREAMEIAGVGVRELARRMDVQHSFLLRRLTGETQQEVQTVGAIALALGVPPAVLWPVAVAVDDPGVGQ